MILHNLLICLICLMIAASVQAAPRELTVFADGTLLELDAAAKKGIVEIALPGPIREGTLRVRPLDSSTVGRVELLPAKIPDKLQKELDSLAEQKSRLQDRMKALEHREGIFAAAAKSQSSKAPRKTKTNPDPLASVRQGTDFAIAQLEAVYTARRRTEQELKRVEARIADVGRKTAAGPTARISVVPATARIRLAAVLQEGGWKPHYEIRLQQTGTADLLLLGDISGLPDGYSVTVAPTALTAGKPQQLYPLPVGSVPRLATWQMPTAVEKITNTPLPSFSFSLTNSSTSTLPAGQAAVYAGGEYIGTTPFPAVPAGASITLTGPSGNQKAGSP